MKTALLVLIATAAVCPAAEKTVQPDWRDIRNGLTIPDEGYCDQPYVVITRDGNWLCTMTTGKGVEGQGGQHVVATISGDHGGTWSELIDIEPADGPEASWVMPLITPSGRVYVFYDYNGDRIDSLGERKCIRADMLGWYVYKYSDDNGRTWSKERFRLPVRMTEMDRQNDWQGRVQIFWGIGKPIIAGDSIFFGFSKIGKYLIEQSEGWFFRSDNLLSEPDPAKIDWQMLPEGEIGLRAPQGPIAEEQNLVALSDGSLYCVYRTIDGHPCHAYSTDGGRTWTPPAYGTYTPDGRLIKHPRACPRLWKTQNGHYLLWYHNHGGKGYEDRNPAWITGGVEKEGRIYWSQPEILFYDQNPETRMSYPDLIEQDGCYWITETQKTVARVHEVDSSLLEGLWKQDTNAEIAENGVILSLDSKGVAARDVAMPRLPALGEGNGFSIEMWVQFEDASGGQVLLDTRNEYGQGILIRTAAGGTVQSILDDGTNIASWACDAQMLQANRPSHVAIIVDGGPKIISFLVDGILCDGGTQRQFGWGRFGPALSDVNGSARLTLAPSLKGKLLALRIYDRYLRTSEAVGNYRVGAKGRG